MSLIERLVRFCCHHAAPVVILCLLAAVAGGYYTAHHFDMNTDSEALISPKIGWRQNELRYDKLFPQQNNLILVVIDGATAERAVAAADLLADKLRTRKDLFRSVRQPDGGDFFDRNGLLFLPVSQVRDITQSLVRAQPFLGAMASDPSLRGVMASLDTALDGIARKQASFADIDRPLSAFADTLGKVARGERTFLPWQALMTGNEAMQRLRTFIEVQPVLDYTALSPGAKATDAIRAAARRLGLTPDHGVRVRLTGPVPLEDEEFATISDRAGLMVGAMLVAVTLTLWLAVGSFRLIFCILVTLLAGLSLTMAAALLTVHVFNIISIAFVALFVGLGVDFGIQFCVRYRQERHLDADLGRALAKAGRSVGMPIALAAAATAAGFFSFLPTNYVGVAELGLIAGMGMIIAFLLSVTMLPALVYLTKPPGEREPVGFAFLAPVDRYLVSHRKRILTVSAAVAFLSLCACAFLHFDFNPLDLRSRHVESMSTLYDLMKNPETSPNTIDVVAPSLAAAGPLAKKLEARRLIGQVLTLESFVPDDQPQKLAMISDASFLLDATLNPFAVKPPPTDADVVASFRATAQHLQSVAGTAQTKGAADARRLAAILTGLANGPQALRDLAREALIPGLDTMLEELRTALQAGPVSLKTMPADMVRDWIAPDGEARLQVFPASTASDNKSLKRFSKEVLAVAPGATGAPISIQESGLTIVGAFIEAGVWSFIAITILLALALRRERDVILTLVPLVFTALLTLATCVVIGLQLNFANIIALPLLLGIGVAFNIYFVVAWREGARNLLQSSLTRAVIFSALTTASGFGTLWLSNHPGTASMGELLIISLIWTLITTLFFLPALLGPPPGTVSPSSAGRTRR